MISRAKLIFCVGWSRDGTGELPNLAPVGSFLHGHGMAYTRTSVKAPSSAACNCARDGCATMACSNL